MRFRSIISCWLALALATACNNYPDPTPSPEPDPSEDPVLAVSVPGAYGAEGGNQLWAPGTQTSLLEYDEGSSWRMIQPSGCKIVSFSSLPLHLSTGQRISFLYRVSEQGITRVCRQYEDVRVLQVKDGMVWLKKDDSTYFLLTL